MQGKPKVMDERTERRLAFVALTVVVFALMSAGLFSIGFVPVSPSAVASEPPAQESDAQASTLPEADLKTPVRIVIDAIDVDETILNPQSQDVEVLDEALLDGVVRYPGSALLGEDNNMLLFGHSSYLPVIHNSAYKAFNDIQKLQKDDVIRVYSEGEEHVYRVTSVRNAPASEVLVRFDTGKRMLTLSTCDSFGGKSDRFVVEAEYVETNQL
jgi:LPXTG-site transpeptidase (sortase) family protein